MVAAPVLWSSAGVVTRHIQSAAPFEQVFWRSLFAFVFVLSILAIQGKHPWRAARAAGLPGFASGLMWAVMFTAFLFALSMTTTANALVVMAVSPLLTALFAWMFLKDPLPARTWIAAGAALLGIAWMFSAQLSAHYAGMAVAFIIPVAAAINVVVLREPRHEGRDRPRPGGDARRRALLPVALPLPCLFLQLQGYRPARLPRLLSARPTLHAARAREPRLAAPEIALLGLLEVVLGPLWAWLGAEEEPGQARC